MLAGFARRSVCPDRPMDLAGFDLRKTDSNGTLAGINVSALSLASDAGESLLLLGFDLLGVPRTFCDRLKKPLSQELAINESRIWLLATHTHAAPRAVFMRGERDEAYVSLLTEQALAASAEAMTGMIEVGVSLGVSAVKDVASYRDVPRERSAYAMPLLRLAFENPFFRCELVRLQCHPTVLDETNFLVSKDLAGAWERADGLCQNTLMANGACGDLSTRYTRQGKGPSELSRIREVLARAVANTRTLPLDSFGKHIKVALANVSIRNAAPLSNDERQALYKAHEQKLQTLTDEAAKREIISIMAVLRREIKPRETSREIALAAADFGDIMLFAMPFDSNSGDGAQMEALLSEKAGKRAFILCYAGGYEGYLPSGKPIGIGSSYQDVAASLAPEVKGRVLDAAEQLIKTIAEGSKNE